MASIDQEALERALVGIRVGGVPIHPIEAKRLAAAILERLRKDNR